MNLLTQPITFWINLFTDINNDPDEEAIPFSDVDFYTQQIVNICMNAGEQVTMQWAKRIAILMNDPQIVNTFKANISNYEQADLVALVNDMLDSGHLHVEYVHNYFQRQLKTIG